MIAGLLFQTSCGTLWEDQEECRFFVEFKYDYNMTSADAFHTKVERVDLYVFDRDGKYLFTQSEQGEPLASGNYRMELTLAPGQYRLMAWAGAGNHDSYDVSALTPGVSSIEEMTLKVKRGATAVIDQQIDDLWYGEILDVNLTGTHHQIETINLIKDTNKVRFVFIGNGDATLNLNEYTYEIIEDNGFLGYDNALLADEKISYRPYYTEQRNASSVVVEMNTLRFMERADARFVVTPKATGVPVLDINLVDYLVLTKMEDHDWDEQQYLDRQDEFAIIYIFAPEGGDLNARWIALQIHINGWTCYIQENEID